MSLPTTDAKANREAASSTASPDVQRSASSAEGGEKSLAETIAAIGNDEEAEEKETSPVSEESTQEEQSSETDQEESEAAEEEPAAEEEDPDAEENQSEENGEEKEEEKPPFHTHPRWKQVQKEKKEALAKVDALQETLEKQKAFVEPAMALHEFCQQHSISDKDLQEALMLAAEAKENPALFAEHLEAMTRNVKVHIGKELTPDLAKRVEEGTLTEADAKEIQEARLAKSRSERTVADVKKDSAKTKEEAFKTQVNAIASAVTQWEATVKKNDPDYKGSFQEMVTDRIEVLCRQSFPANIEQALAIADKAYKECQTRVRSFRPATKPAARKELKPTGSSKPKNGDIAIKDLRTDVRKVVDMVCAKK